MQIETPWVNKGEWVRISGHNPADLRTYYVTIGDETKPAGVEKDELLVRCPDIKEKTEVIIDGEKIGYVRPKAS